MASLSAVKGVLGRRNAQIYYAGSLVCWTGSWAQRIATDWLAWQLTHSVMWVAVMAFCNLVPSVIVSPLAGAAADRMDRIHLTMISQFVSAGQAAVLAVLVLTGAIRIEYMVVLACIGGTAETFAQPARQCIVPGLVPRAFLPGAVALNSLTYNLARFIGPALSGPMVAAWGVVPPIVLNGLAYLYASVTMLMLDLDPSIRRSQRSTGSVLHDAIEGVRYVANHRGIGPIMLFAATVGMLLRSVPEMLPPFVADQFGRGAEGLATLASAMGFAALIGGSYVAVRGRLRGLTQLAMLAGLGLAVATAGFAATHWFPFGVVAIAGMGMATTMHGISIQTLLQNACAPHMVGRVLSLWGMIVRAGPAMGALMYGAAAEVVGLQIPVLIGVVLCVGMWFRTWRRRDGIASALEGG